MKVRDLMNSDVVTVRKEASVREAAALMAREAVGCVVVTDGRGCVEGILTGRDVLQRVAGTGLDSRTTSVGEAMTSPALSLGPEDDIGRATHLMTERGFRRVPVVEDGRLVGLLTSADIVMNPRRFEEAAGGRARWWAPRPTLPFAMVVLGVALLAGGAAAAAMRVEGSLMGLAVGGILLPMAIYASLTQTEGVGETP